MRKEVFMMREITLMTESGYVKGCVENGFIAFKGIPYAKAERFKAPVSCHWNGVCDCTKFGKKAMQSMDASPWMPAQPREDFDEDCLNLNIFIPEGTVAGAQLPVLLEIHGGAYQSGSNQDRKVQDVIKDEKIIYVAINYRLGALGYLYLGSLLGEDYRTSGNNGLLDQLAAIRWVYENIQYFGGDPEKITVLGSSAGAKSIGALMMIPEFNTYASQLIMSSGATQSIRSIATSEVTAKGFMDTLKSMAPDLGLNVEEITGETLLTLSPDDIIKVQKVFCDNPGNTCMFGPVADEVVIKADWKETAAAGTYWSGRTMIGSSRNELGFNKIFDKDFAAHAPAVADALFGMNGKIAKDDYEELLLTYINEYGCEPSKEVQADLWVRIITDYMYRLYSYRLAERLFEKDCKVWQYSVELLPALHCADQQLAFSEPEAMFYGSQEAVAKAKEVGQMIRQSFMNFVEHGDPGVEAWKPLSVRSWKAMYWDAQSEVRTIPEDDVLKNFPEEVYILAK